MNSAFFNALLPFWILGFPLVIAIVNLVLLPKQSEIARSDHIPRTQPDERVGDAQRHATH